MQRDEMFILKDYLNGEQVDTKDIEKVTKKLNLICKQIELQEEFQKEVQNLTNEIDKL